jgi:hypothetical protein
MAEQLSPQDADRALQEMSDRRSQVAGAPAPWPVIVLSCVLLIVFGFLLDQFPDTGSWLGTALVGITFGLMYLARTRYFGARLGHRVAPTRASSGTWKAKLLAAVLLVGAIVLLLVCHAQLVRNDVAWPNLITYGVLGSVLSVLISQVMSRVIRASQRMPDNRA